MAILPAQDGIAYQGANVEVPVPEGVVGGSIPVEIHVLRPMDRRF